MKVLPAVLSIVALLGGVAGAADRIEDSGVEYMPGWVDVPVVPDPVCQRPKQGFFLGSCEALRLGEDLQFRSKHLGDVWVNCEAPKHGSAGYGAAVFIGEEVSPYWASEIDSYLVQIRHRASAKAANEIFATHEDWLKRRDGLRSALKLKFSELGGTLLGYMVEHGYADIDRSEALRLGCVLEKLPSP